MTPHPEPAFFAGIDWGSQSHDACVLKGTVLGEQEFKHSGSGLGLLIDGLLARTHTGAGQVRVAIEIPHGPVVNSLLDRGFPVHPINPKQLNRFSPSGAKNDRRDARVRADAHCLCALRALDSTVAQLGEWSRMADDLTRERKP